MIKADSWDHLKSFTAARIALGRAGGSLPTKEWLRFRKDHALARDAVWEELNTFDLENKLSESGLKFLTLSSRAETRDSYIKRPDLGRKLNGWSVNQLQRRPIAAYDIGFVITEGLSAPAIHAHAINFIKTILSNLSQYTIAPFCIVKNGRVAIGDEVGQHLNCKLIVVLIGERPGLTTPDSMGIYMTYSPEMGKTDETRNCISNIRPEGLSYLFAAQKLNYLINESMSRKLSGVHLKDNFDQQLNS